MDKENSDLGEVAMENRSDKDDDGDEPRNGDEKPDQLAEGTALENQDGISDISEDEDYSQSTSDEDEDEKDLRPAKRRKTHSPHLPTPASDIQMHTPPPSRSPSASESSALAAEYRERPFSGYFKSVRIGTRTTFSFDITFDDSPEHLGQPSHLNLSSSILSTIAPCQEQQSTLYPPRKRNPWTIEEDGILKKMKGEDNYRWEEIAEALPNHTRNSIVVRYS
jgi:hypothetical protein